MYCAHMLIRGFHNTYYACTIKITYLNHSVALVVIEYNTLHIYPNNYPPPT